MTASGAPLSPPGPRTAAGLWSCVAAHSPSAVVAGIVPIHRVEVLVEVDRRAPLDPFTRTLLTAIPLADPPTAIGLDRLLFLGEERVDAALTDACRIGWVESTGGGRVRVSAEGRDALDRGRPVRPFARRRFAFRNGQYVPLPDSGPILFGAPGSRSSVAPHGLPLVRSACGQTLEWKHAAGFPEVGSVVEPSGHLEDELRWQTIPVEDEELLGLVVMTDTASARVLGFVPAVDWSLSADPTFTLAGDPGRAAFPEVFTGPSDADCQAAWLGWAKFRGVPPDDLTSCGVALHRDRLDVRAPARLIDWLRAHRADVLAGDTWVWVGTGQLRRPAVIDVRANG